MVWFGLVKILTSGIRKRGRNMGMLDWFKKNQESANFKTPEEYYAWKEKWFENKPSEDTTNEPQNKQLDNPNVNIADEVQNPSTTIPNQKLPADINGITFDFELPQHERIMKESLDIINQTKNVDTAISRFQVIKTSISRLFEIKPPGRNLSVEIRGKIINTTDTISVIDNVKTEFVRNYFVDKIANETKKADGVSDLKTKKKQYKKALNIAHKSLEYIENDEVILGHIQSIENLIAGLPELKVIGITKSKNEQLDNPNTKIADEIQNPSATTPIQKILADINETSFGKDDRDTPESLYIQAKLISRYLFEFPYIDPPAVDSSLHNDKPLMDIIIFAHQTTIGSDGRICQTTIDAAERIRYQAEFKKRIFDLLDKCLSSDPDYAPAFLLYPKVAEWNTRAADRQGLIILNERFLSKVDQITKGSRTYSLIEKDIKGVFGSHYDQVERYLADFNYELGNLYLKQDQLQQALERFKRAETLMPPIYAGTTLPLLEKALGLPVDKSQKELISRRYENVKSAMERPKKLLEIAGEILAVIEQNQGILQKEIYGKFNSIPKNDIALILRSLDDRCLILRKKKGSFYQLTLEMPISEALEVVKQLQIEDE